MTATTQLMLSRKWYQGSIPEMEFHMMNIIYAALSISAQTEKTTFSCKDDCTLTKHTGPCTYSARDFEIPLCHTPPLRSFFGYLRPNFDSVESRISRWYCEGSKQMCERSEHILAKFGAQRQFFASNIKKLIVLAIRLHKRYRGWALEFVDRGTLNGYCSC